MRMDRVVRGGPFRPSGTVEELASLVDKMAKKPTVKLADIDSVFQSFNKGVSLTTHFKVSKLIAAASTAIAALLARGGSPAEVCRFVAATKYEVNPLKVPYTKIRRLAKIRPVFTDILIDPGVGTLTIAQAVDKEYSLDDSQLSRSLYLELAARSLTYEAARIVRVGVDAVEMSDPKGLPNYTPLPVRRIPVSAGNYLVVTERKGVDFTKDSARFGVKIVTQIPRMVSALEDTEEVAVGVIPIRSSRIFTNHFGQLEFIQSMMLKLQLGMLRGVWLKKGSFLELYLKGCYTIDFGAVKVMRGYNPLSRNWKLDDELSVEEGPLLVERFPLSRDWVMLGARSSILSFGQRRDPSNNVNLTFEIVCACLYSQLPVLQDIDGHIKISWYTVLPALNRQATSREFYFKYMRRTSLHQVWVGVYTSHYSVPKPKQVKQTPTVSKAPASPKPKKRIKPKVYLIGGAESGSASVRGVGVTGGNATL